MLTSPRPSLKIEVGMRKAIAEVGMSRESQVSYRSWALLVVAPHVIAVVRSGHDVVEGRPQLCLACRKVSASELVGQITLAV